MRISLKKSWLLTLVLSLALVAAFSAAALAAEATYSDVAEDAWYFNYVEKLTAGKVVDGYTDGTFKPQGLVTNGEALKLVMLAAGYEALAPTGSHWASGYLDKAVSDKLLAEAVELNQPITRLEIAQLITAALKLSATGTSPFSDTSDAAAIALAAAGISNGYTDGTFGAAKNLTRAEVTTMIFRVKVYQPTTKVLVADVDNKVTNAVREDEPADEFGWYRWDFKIDSALDAVGTAGDGIGTIYYRVFVPETETGKNYPLVANLGGLGSTNCMADNGYAKNGMNYASAVNQAKNPSYVVTFHTPFEACTNYAAELAYVYQYGEIVKAVNEEYGNVDMNRIYATGLSQGAGWSYELAAVQPDLLAAVLINAGTTVHTTWGDQCDMNAIAKSKVNIYILHGNVDKYIPVNEAYRVYNTLTDLGKKNITLEITGDGHVVPTCNSATEITKYMEWMYAQTKDKAFSTKPEVIEAGAYTDYWWAGIQVLPAIDGWATALDYANWTEPAKNTTWETLKEQSEAYATGKGGTGKTWLARVRIGDECQTTYDLVEKAAPGDVIAVTVQGYTGAFGDDWAAFNKEWTVDWAVLKGSVTGIELTKEASATPIVRPATVNLANGGGPNVNNSLYNENALDGNQVYVKINLAEDFSGDTVKVALRFTRTLGGGEYASYWHVIELPVGK